MNMMVSPHSSPILRCVQVLHWIWMQPSAWQAFTRNHNLSPDFSLVQLTKTHWQQKAVRQVVGTAVIYPILSALITALVLWGAQIQPTHLLFSVGFSVLFTLLLEAVIGVLLSVHQGFGTAVIMSTLVSIAAGFFVDQAAGLQGLVGGIRVHLIIPLLGVSLVTGLVAGVGLQQGATRSRFAGGNRFTTLLAGAILGIAVGIPFGLYGLLLFHPCGLGVVYYWRISCAADAVINSNGFTATLPALVFGLVTAVFISWRTRRMVLSGLVGIGFYGVMLFFANMGTIDEIIRWALEASCVGADCSRFSTVYYLSVNGAFVAPIAGLSVPFVLAYLLGRQIAHAWVGAVAGGLALITAVIGWLVALIVVDPIFRVVVTPTVVKLGTIVALAFLVGFTFVWWRALLMYPFEMAWNWVLLLTTRHRQSPQLSKHAAFWDEQQFLPMFGLVDHLVLTAQHQPITDYEQRLTQTPQKWAAKRAQLILLSEQLAQLQTATAVSQAHTTIRNAHVSGSLWQSLIHLSQDSGTALNQVTPYHQRLMLRSVVERLNQLLRELQQSDVAEADYLVSVVVSWQHVLSAQVQQLAETAVATAQIDNPYIFGIPLTEQQEIFTGRTEISAQIEKLLLDLRHPPLFLYGQRRMGKTSLLRNLGRLLPSTIVPLFVDGEGLAGAQDLAGFLYSMTRQIARSAKQQRDLTLPTPSRTAFADDPLILFNEWLDDVESVLLEQSNRVALLMLDEFEAITAVLTQYADGDVKFLRILRHLIQHRTQFKVLLASSHPLESLAQWAGYLLNVQVVKMGPLHSSETHQLITQPIPDFQLRYEDDACERVVALTNGHPYLVQLLCYEIVVLKNKQPAAQRWVVQVEDVETAVAPALKSGTFFFTDIQQNQVNPEGARILQAIAQQTAPVTHQQLNLLCGDDAITLLPPLIQRDLLVQKNATVHFQVELIRRWFCRV